MDKTQHTPGPWRVGKYGPNLCPTIGTQAGLTVAMVSYGEDHPTEANARLIAAAPDLLVAVQRCLNFIEGTEAEFGEEFECGNLARASIAKAEGWDHA